MEPPAALPVARVARFLAVLGCALIVFEFLRKLTLAQASTHIAPGLAVTTGCEQESVFALWRSLHGQPLYGDETRLPFASAYFNWLFYSGYTVPLRAVGAASDSLRIVQGGRMLTALAAAVGAVTTLGLFRRAVSANRALAALVLTSVFLGPLVDWWAHTVRPDLWALALESIGIAVLLRWSRERPWPATLAALAFLYGAWACKQTYVGGLASAIVFLGSRRHWKLVGVLGAGSAVLWGLTLLALGPEYRAVQLGAATLSEFSFSIGRANFVAFLRRALPLLLLAAAAVATTRRVRREPGTLAADARVFGTIGICVTLPLTFLAASKLGSNSNYFFSLTLMLGVLILGSLEALSDRWQTLAGLAAAISIQVAATAGIVGEHDLSSQSTELEARWTEFQKLPEPRFSYDSRLGLPWLNPHSPPIVVAFDYPILLRRGARFEAGGVGGLVGSGHFAALLLPTWIKDEVYGGRLDRYRPGETVAGMVVYRREVP